MRPRWRPYPGCLSQGQVKTRSLFQFLRKRAVPQGVDTPQPILSQDDLFHPLSRSPFAPLRARGESMRKLAHCPTCSARSMEKPFRVAFECPNCGWPTHCSESHWNEDGEHARYCSRLKEINEDEHDVRSGRHLFEFEAPGPQDTEAEISFSNWDVLWYTRGFPSMNTERSRRLASKVLTFPLTIGNVLHQNSAFSLRNQRLTGEGLRSLAALRTNLHAPTGTPELAVGSYKEQIRVFIVGARAESFLPAYLWQQLPLLFHSSSFHIYHIGPQVSLPDFIASPVPNKDQMEEGKRLWQPPTPPPIKRMPRMRDSSDQYGAPAYTLAYSPELHITGIRTVYQDLHALFSPFDPYTDVFFLFSPGFGFPSITARPLLQIAAPQEWGLVVPQLLETKCPIFVTGFSPADVERDVRSLDGVDGVSGEYDWILRPGQNPFASERWEVAEFDPRVMVQVNWGIWGIRGKRRDIQEGFVFSL